MQTGWVIIDGSNTYYFNSEGVMQRGLQTIDGKTYYFYEDGKMAKNTVLEDGTQIDENGAVIDLGGEA